MRRTEAEARRCSQEGCPGDGRYQPPGKGHLSGCQHNAVKWVWEEKPAPTGTEATTARIAAVLAEHETRVSVMGGWSSRNGQDSDRRYGWTCSCGAENDNRFKIDLTREEVDLGRHAHLAAVLSAGVIRDMQAAAWDEGKTAHARQQLDIAYGRARQFSDPINPYRAVSIEEGA